MPGPRKSGSAYRAEPYRQPLPDVALPVQAGTSGDIVPMFWDGSLNSWEGRAHTGYREMPEVQGQKQGCVGPPPRLVAATSTKVTETKCCRKLSMIAF